MSDAPTIADELSEEDKRKELAMHLAAVVRLAKELPLENDIYDPYAGVDIPEPIGETVDVSDHPAIHKAVESFKAAEAEVGIVNAVVNVFKQIGESYGLVIGA